ncbi:hypothetical protein HOY80DRAFT_280532 [Tuber brumale]|nr:hypothetical protein HOY80DRAFT_280532 [Tuber brumale]
MLVDTGSSALSYLSIIIMDTFIAGNSLPVNRISWPPSAVGLPRGHVAMGNRFHILCHWASGGGVRSGGGSFVWFPRVSAELFSLPESFLAFCSFAMAYVVFFLFQGMLVYWRYIPYRYSVVSYYRIFIDRLVHPFLTSSCCARLR